MPLLEIASAYLDDSDLSLRKAVKQKGNDIVYANSQNAQALSLFTLARWLTFLGIGRPRSVMERFAAKINFIAKSWTAHVGLKAYCG